MTQTGKCDTCRQRKVKCDEGRPRCGACQKKDRPCTYSYGKASVVVVQDPNQLSKHGKSKTAPVVYALDSSEKRPNPSGSTRSDLRITTEREAENGQGFFHTFTSNPGPKARLSKKKAAFQRRLLEAHLQRLQEESVCISAQPSSPETTLISRYIGMLGFQKSDKEQPLSILGSWIQSIPSRIGSNPMLDLAVEFFINSSAVYWDDTHSKRKQAAATKAKALRELQLAVVNAQHGPSYEILLATKMHYASEALMGIETMYHAIHAFGLAELLKAGPVSNADDEHFWNLVDNTYIDDVNEAMLGGRTSVYDNNFYLSSTYPPSFDFKCISLSASQRASMAIMHVFIQCPRLVCLVRYAILNRGDTSALASALSHAGSLWQIDLQEQVAELLQASVTVASDPPNPEMVDIMPDSLDFDTVQNWILCTRYWSVQNLLCGLADTLHRHFPAETALSLLPSLAAIRIMDVDAAFQLAKSLPWALSVSKTLPLVPLRLHAPLQISIGTWHRAVRDLNAIQLANPDPDLEVNFDRYFEFLRAERMKTWLNDQCNRIHGQWSISSVDEAPLLELIDSMAGEKIPDWLPVRVRFDAEDGEMVMKLDYENRKGNYEERYDIGERSPKKILSLVALTAEGVQQRQNPSVEELPFPGINSKRPCAPTAASLDHSNGNAFEAPSWFPYCFGGRTTRTDRDTPNTSAVLLNSSQCAFFWQARAAEQRRRVKENW